jgi:phosphosulfolactate phosphohydrolase-like enzyme
MLPDKSVMCPYTGFSKTCFEGVAEHSCPKWVHIVGANPQTGASVDRFACSDAIMPMLMIENSQQQRQTGAAVESFRNEMVRLNEQPHLMLHQSPSPSS